MKIANYTICHYGKTYIHWALRSVYEVVDKIAIFYVENPSHGTKTDTPCPESEEDIRKEALKYDPDNKIEWIKGEWNNEIAHRSHAVNWAKENGYDILINTDTDEIWDTKELKKCIEDIKKNPAYDYKIKMIHLWKSFNWACEDEMRQGRIMYLDAPIGTIRYSDAKNPQIYHFGYAILNQLMGYKISIHGHKNEMRTDCNWEMDKWDLWKPGDMDTHPTCIGIWNPFKWNKNNLPNFMREHPYWDKDIIE